MNVYMCECVCVYSQLKTKNSTVPRRKQKLDSSDEDHLEEEKILGRSNALFG